MDKENPAKEPSTEQLILETAEKLFLEKGFAMTSTVEIARQAGCNQALVHYYFRTKENLFQSIFEKKLRLLVSSFMEASDPQAPFIEKLKRIVESHFDIIQANPGLPFLIFNELITNPVRLNSLKERLKELPLPVFMGIEQDLQAEVSAGRIRPVSAFDLIITIVSLNVMPFIASSVIRNILELNDQQYMELMQQRKRLNVETVLLSLRP